MLLKLLHVIIIIIIIVIIITIISEENVTRKRKLNVRRSVYIAGYTEVQSSWRSVLARLGEEGRGGGTERKRDSWTV